ncbi:MAG: histidinol dehydrogenase [Succinivibrionaceae bacterium]|nr:histidinol dehydrogenase [Succinivibrionaceae bacterium]
MDIRIWADLDEDGREQALERPAANSATAVDSAVDEIVMAVEAEGDAALRRYEQKFGNLADEPLELTREERLEANRELDPQLREAIDKAYHNIKIFHEAQRPREIELEIAYGVTCRTAAHAIDRVGLYVPGGSAPLFSTALMLATPAQIAGCREVILCSPGPIHPAIIHAATLAGVDRIFRVGGAQAIAAMAYGTESVPQVDKIFGPGNQYVTSAKELVSSDVAIDMPAGPSEVLVIADDEANPDFVAADLLSQAEHGPDSQAILVTDSESLARRTLECVERQVEGLPREDIARRALEHSCAIVCKDLAECAAVSSAYAPEHLIVQTRDPEALLPELRNAGSIFLGAYTPEALGDYASGTNHTLPTYGNARAYSALGTDDFRRRYTIQTASRKGLERIARVVETMADAEGLEAHRRAVSLRLGEE